MNIINRHAGMYWVEGPLSYETGESPYAQGKAGVAFYWNPANLDRCLANLGRIGTALVLVVRTRLTEAELAQQPWSGRMTALREVLRLNWDSFDWSVKKFLTDQGLTRG